jgi:hypothetical protein
VYTPTDIILSFIPSVNIPTSSLFYIEFPPNITAITTNTNLLKIGNTSQSIISSSLINNAFSVSFLSGGQLNAGSNVSITIKLTTPSNIGTYTYVKLIVSKNNVNYLTNTG